MDTPGTCGNGICEEGETEENCRNDCLGGPAPAPCNSCGDVHVRTPDGLAYDFQGAGEFLLIESDDGSVVVQARQEPWGSSTRVTVNTAATANIAGDRVGVYVDRSPSLYVNGTPTSLDGNRLQLPEGGTIYGTSNGYLFRWPSDFLMSVHVYGSYLNIGIARPGDPQQSFTGLLGNLNGDPEDDVSTRSGQQLSTPVAFDDLYDVFGNSWRIDQEESLFDYQPGNNTDTFILPDFPSGPLTAGDLDPADFEAARQICEAAGITDPILLEDCILDVGITGDNSFTQSGLDSEPPEVALDVELPVFFDDWTPESGSAGGGRWTIGEDGRSVLQTVNGEPTFFVSPREFINVTIRGKFRVETGLDDDYIGFVIGYKSPLSAEGGDPDAFDFVLFDWKQSDQGAGREGLTLARVQGVIQPENNTYPAFVSHQGDGMTVLASDYGDDKGWQDRTEYTFELIYEANRVQISIDEEVIFDVEGTFEPGRFGFYNFSQQGVRYYDFSATDIESGMAKL